jgi:hypothetical protein
MMISVHLSIWDATTGKQLSRRPLGVVQPTPSQGHVELAPDGESITVWQSDGIAAWRGDQLTLEDISTKRLLATLPRGVGHPLAFSADGRLLAVFLQPRLEHYPPWLESERVPEMYDVKGLSLIETASGQEVVRLDIRRFDHVAFTPDGRALVVVDKQKLSVWDAATGERLHQMEWPESVRDIHGYAKIASLAVLPDGRAATGMTEGDILVWDLAAPTWPVHKPVGEPSRSKLEAMWSDLAGDARRAYRAVRTLAETPAQTVAFLGDHLQPVTVDGKRMERLLADLDGNEFAAREAADRELTELGDRAESMLRQALEGKPSLELRRRLQAILAGPNRLTADSLRTLRAIAVLERIATPQARRILETLGRGAASRETREAKTALQRLDRR